AGACVERSARAGDGLCRRRVRSAVPAGSDGAVHRRYGTGWFAGAPAVRSAQRYRRLAIGAGRNRGSWRAGAEPVRLVAARVATLQGAAALAEWIARQLRPASAQSDAAAVVPTGVPADGRLRGAVQLHRVSPGGCAFRPVIEGDRPAV